MGLQGRPSAAAVQGMALQQAIRALSRMPQCFSNDGKWIKSAIQPKHALIGQLSSWSLRCAGTARDDQHMLEMLLAECTALQTGQPLSEQVCAA